MPSLFISHGAPNMILHGGATHDFFETLGRSLTRPKAILVVSAHWETEEPMLTAHPNPQTIYDFYGFEPEMYRMSYNAPGAPDRAEQARVLVPLASLEMDRGIDHGAWSPLKIIYPDADIPVFQLSVQPHKNALHHYNIGQQLRDLRENGMMVLASGNATHNLRAVFRSDANDTPKSTAFAQWLAESLGQGDHPQVLEWEKAAPYALWNHPTPEHFLPLFVAMGASDASAKVDRLHQGIELNVLAMDAYQFS
jgi:4,5-DOPA dioxygenase extradiol